MIESIVERSRFSTYWKSDTIADFGLSCFNEVVHPEAENLLFWLFFALFVLFTESIDQRYVSYC